MTATHHPKIYVAGHRGMAGSAIVRALLAQGTPQQSILTRTHAELDLCNQQAVGDFFRTAKPDVVYLAAARVGGIWANSHYPADFLYQNLMIEANVLDAAHRNGVQQLLFLGSSCIYPRMAPQPMAEGALLTGTLEPTNEPYAIAKIAGIKLCESYQRQYGRDYRSVMPTNLYGPGDNYHPVHSHVIPALIRRFHEAKIASSAQVVIWGTGTPRREFLYVDDMAAACVFVMQLDLATYRQHTTPMCSHLNVGFGSDLPIAELAQTIAEVVGYNGNIVFDPTQPDGAPRKWMDSSVLHNLGWRPRVGLREGLALAYADFVRSHCGEPAHTV
ncbi:GDP-L-fucose synthase family protein [Candidatus Symbiobacter mobilis]|uniref:GDP-L-fucose synthase n=1 Tax=Candidatus Symbiobacter mobilis CR TaxID=946483 RepID=U5NEK0_9BURK|nr:GDP-L-fucose synthase [Candidatus Symbiobacter mobilis]AGX88658.1 GDP-L-fucose synthase [Candidatus Symbiobacter mobilis CR]